MTSLKPHTGWGLPKFTAHPWRKCGAVIPTSPLTGCFQKPRRKGLVNQDRRQALDQSWTLSHVCSMYDFSSFGFCPRRVVMAARRHHCTRCHGTAHQNMVRMQASRCAFYHTHKYVFKALASCFTAQSRQAAAKGDGNASHSEGSAQTRDGFAPNQNPVKSFTFPDLITPCKETTPRKGTTPRKNPRSVESHAGQKPLHTASENVDRWESRAASVKLTYQAPCSSTPSYVPPRTENTWSQKDLYTNAHSIHYS